MWLCVLEHILLCVWSDYLKNKIKIIIMIWGLFFLISQKITNCLKFIIFFCCVLKWISKILVSVVSPLFFFSAYYMLCECVVSFYFFSFVIVFLHCWSVRFFIVRNYKFVFSILSNIVISYAYVCIIFILVIVQLLKFNYNRKK